MTIIKKFEPLKKRENRIFKHLPSKKFTMFFSFTGLAVLIVLEIWINNTMAIYGGKLEKITSLQQDLRLENQVLENDIAKLSSLSNVASQSSMLGFSPAKDIKYIR